MGKQGNTKRNTIFSRITFVALLFITMAAATLHLGAVPAQAGQASLSWAAPTTNTNGTTLTDLGGYKIHFGTTSKNYTQHIDVGKMTNYVATNLTDGSTYYFAVTAYDTSGLESAYSNEVSKSLTASATTYTVTATAGSGGTITAVNNTKISTATNSTSTVTSVTVTSGTSQSFTIAPGTGYAVQGVTVDGASVGAVTSYTFNNVTANHTIAATFAASTTSGGTTSGGTTSGGTTSGGTTSGGTTSGTSTFAVNCGGAAYTGSGVSYLADTKFSGGSTGTTTATISGTTDGTLYQSERYGNFSYSIPVSNGNYNVTLKFAETYFTATGKRVFSVAVNGATAVSSLDIYAKAGANKAYDVVVPVSVTNGAINITFTSQVNNAEVRAIKVVPATTATSTSSAGTVAFATNSGGSSYTSASGVAYKADASYTGGSVGTTTSTISGTTDGPVYQSERYGNFSYSIPLTNGNYSVTLKFAETYFGASGQRVFDVAANGATAVSALDIFAKAGKNAAYDVVLPVTVSNGTLKLDFISKVNNAEVRGIVIKTM